MLCEENREPPLRCSKRRQPPPRTQPPCVARLGLAWVAAWLCTHIHTPLTHAPWALLAAAAVAAAGGSGVEAAAEEEDGGVLSDGESARSPVQARRRMVLPHDPAYEHAAVAVNPHFHDYYTRQVGLFGENRERWVRRCVCVYVWVCVWHARCVSCRAQRAVSS
jgi:hypothetical protein